jgi:glycine/D-amino acid oxidase-like deaminating enzyme
MTHAAATDRRRFLGGSAALGGLGLAGLSACVTSGAAGPGPGVVGPAAALAPVRASADRLFDITVCLRPFRAAGPRLDTERIGDTLVVHNYGHGGSGWSLSWGSGALAVAKAMSASPKSVAVIGCGALGLTAATLAQRAGARVTIYARDLLPQTRSARATGSWTPDSRIALTAAAGPAFGPVWEQMARTSFKTYRQYLGLPGSPVEWTDRYFVSEIPPEEDAARHEALNTLGFADYRDRIADLTPRSEVMPPGTTPFPARFVRRTSSMMFNIADYGHTLMSDFLLAGGQIRRMEFHTPADIAALDEKVVINCPGYGARDLWKDETVVPVRGQIAWLIPQPDVTYGVIYNDVSMLSRRDGIVIQALDGGDLKGYGDAHEVIDRGEADRAVATIAALYARMAGAAAKA